MPRGRRRHGSPGGTVSSILTFPIRSARRATCSAKETRISVRSAPTPARVERNRASTSPRSDGRLAGTTATLSVEPSQRRANSCRPAISSSVAESTRGEITMGPLRPGSDSHSSLRPSPAVGSDRRRCPQAGGMPSRDMEGRLIQKAPDLIAGDKRRPSPMTTCRAIMVRYRGAAARDELDQDGRGCHQHRWCLQRQALRLRRRPGP